MNVDLPAALSFLAAHARLLDRRRLELLLDGGDPAPVLAAVDAYRNPDGGYSPATSPRAVELCEPSSGAAT